MVFIYLFLTVPGLCCCAWVFSSCISQASHCSGFSWASLVAQTVKNLPAMQETQVQSLGQEDPLEKGMTIHSSVLAWRIPWIEEPVRILSMGSQRLQHD